MASSIPLQLAETIQTAHLRHNPSAAHDVAPSTAADFREPVVLEALDDDDDDGDDDDDENEAQYSVIREWNPLRDDNPQNRPLAGAGAKPGAPARARTPYHLPPLPDLRFEQSYLNSLAAAGNVWWKAALITMRDQLLMPLMQGVVYNLAVLGWQHWNRNAVLSGRSVGARVRRWWYGVNNWPLPAGVTTTGVSRRRY